MAENDGIMASAPIGAVNHDVQEAVREDIRRRRAHGIAKFGQPLMAGDGSDPLAEAYWQALDMVFFLKQLLIERETS